MEQSESVVELLTALCAARLEFNPVVRNREGFSKRGGQKYGYADLNAIIDATAPALAAHGLTMMQFIEDAQDESHAVVKSILAHISGQWIGSSLTVLRDNDPQNFGIITTYAKRYKQQAMLNISSEEDDKDGRTDEGKESTRERRNGSRQDKVVEPVKATDRHEPDEAKATVIEAIRTCLREHFPNDRHAAMLAVRACFDVKKWAEVEEKTTEELQHRYGTLLDTMHRRSALLDDDDVPLTYSPDEPEIDEPSEASIPVASTDANPSTEPSDALEDNIDITDVVTPDGEASKNDWWKLSKRAREAGISTATWDVMRAEGYPDALEKVEALEDAKKSLIS